MKGVMADPVQEVERRRKISESRRLKKERLGYINSPETRVKMAAASKGRKWTAIQREKLLPLLKARRPSAETIKKMLDAAHAAPKRSGVDHPHWKGDAIGYSGIHMWVRIKYGRADHCEGCGVIGAKRYEWANISLRYSRDRSDWRQLCTSCHRAEGYKRGEYVAWNKGSHIRTNTGRTHIKKGQHLSPATEFTSSRSQGNVNGLPLR